MPAALVQLIQNEFNESFHQAFTSHLPVRWPHFAPLVLTLATGPFHLVTVTMLGGFQQRLPTTIAPHRRAGPPRKTLTTPYRGGEFHTAIPQVVVQNPAPIPEFQVGPGFRLRQSMEQAAETSGTTVPQKDDGRPFCLSYHLKGVCNSKCGGRHEHRTLSLHEQGILRTWKSRYCAAQPKLSILQRLHGC